MSTQNRRDPGPEPSAAAQARQHPAVFGAHSIRTLGLGFKSCGATRRGRAAKIHECGTQLILLSTLPRSWNRGGTGDGAGGERGTGGNAVTGSGSVRMGYGLAGDQMGRGLAGDQMGRGLAGDQMGRGLAGDQMGRGLAREQMGARTGPGADGGTDWPGTRCATALIQRQPSTIMRWRGSESGRHPCRGPAACAQGQAVASARSSVKPRVLLGSTGMPGPIVVVNVTFFRYRPLAAAGLSLITSSKAAA
jgi:hypothetical protein